MKFQNVHISHQDEDKEKLLPNDKDVEKADGRKFLILYSFQKVLVFLQKKNFP